MAIDAHKEQFGEWAIADWAAGEELANPEVTLPRLAVEYDAKHSWGDLLASFLETPAAALVPGLVVGAWDGEMFEGRAAPMVEALVAASESLPNLKALFVGDITYEQWEISWIEQSDLSPLLNAFPQMEWFGARGGNGLSLGTPRHEKLKGLVLEAGGLPGEVVRSLHGAQLPALEHLELWLGTSEYNGTVTIEDLRPILDGTLFPNLTYLGLCNSEIVDEIAEALQGAAVLSKISVLDLSMGVLTDRGAQALLDNPAIGDLETLKIHYHYCSPEMTERLRALEIEVDISEPETADTYGDGDVYRYVAHSE